MSLKLKAHLEQRKAEEAKWAEYDRYNAENTAAGKKYTAVTAEARRAYDEVMADWEAVKHLPYQLRPRYDQYAAQAKSNHNAISVPAYNEYVNAVNALKAQGHQIIQTYRDSSW